MLRGLGWKIERAQIKEFANYWPLCVCWVSGDKLDLIERVHDASHHTPWTAPGFAPRVVPLGVQNNYRFLTFTSINQPRHETWRLDRRIERSLWRLASISQSGAPWPRANLLCTSVVEIWRAKIQGPWYQHLAKFAVEWRWQARNQTNLKRVDRNCLKIPVMIF